MLANSALFAAERYSFPGKCLAANRDRLNPAGPT
jgi:hypothetical protein